MLGWIGDLLAWITPPASAHVDTAQVEAALSTSPQGGVSAWDIYTTTISYDYDSLYRLTNAIANPGEIFTYTYDTVGNRLSQVTNSKNITYVYDIANRLTSVGGATYTWDENGNLLNDGVNTYTYDHANRLKTVASATISTTYAYNGLGDRVQQTVNGVPETYLLDIASGLTQALEDGTNSYLYGVERISQHGITVTEYFLGDALGSVRQLADEDGEVTLAKSYEPYGEVLDSGGGGESNYGFTGEWTDGIGLVNLRARYYAPWRGRFINRDKWNGDYFAPMSYNKWLFVLDNPINYVDPNGLFSESIIQNNLQGKTLFNSFGTEHLGVSRWGLYTLLRDAKDYDQITLRYADFLFTKAQKYYPLIADNDDLWNVHLDCDKLIFSNNQGVGISLVEFLTTIENKAEYKSSISDRWWRPATLQYHWYDLNGRFYSDFYKGSHMPDVLVVGGSYGVFSKGSFLDVHDRYGNEYETLSLGLTLGGSIFEVWEGYASLYNPNSRLSSEIPNEYSLRMIIEGWAANASVSMGTVGIGKSWWRIGGITLVGGRNLNMGAMVSISHTDYKSFNVHQKWSWVDEDIPTYGPTHIQ